MSKDEELEAIRAAFIHEEQRIPTDEEQRVLSCDLARLGPLLPLFLRRLKENNSRSGFELQQQQWTHLAGEWSRYWRMEDGKQPQPDKPLYAPLDKQKREIRVLQVSRLSPVDSNTTPDLNGNEAFKANLLHVSLDDDPAYIAISYAWGDRSPAGRFKSDQEGAAKFEYNRAVFEILNALVPDDSALYLWIDALCINQKDNAEKEIQVALMGDVFRKARQVVIFLGEADEDTTTNMDLLYRAGPVMETICPGEFYFDEEIARLEAESTKAGISLRAWRSVHTLVFKKWFTRYWIIQEVALGICPVVTCGRHAVSWDVFSTVHGWIFCKLSMISELIDRTLPYDGTFYLKRLNGKSWLNLGCLKTVRRQIKSEVPLFFGWMVNELDLFEATDPRDRIFAITGLASLSKVEEEDFRPDYEIRVEELYTKVTRHLLMGVEGPMTLYRAGVGVPRSLSLPSWVPDWTSKGEWKNLFTVSMEEGQNMNLRVEFVPESPHVAVLHACIMDSVQRLSPIRDPYFFTRPWSEERPAEKWWIDSVLELIASHTPVIDYSAACRDAPIGSPAWKYCLWGTLLATSQGPEAFEECVFDDYLENLGCVKIKIREPSDLTAVESFLSFGQSVSDTTYGRRLFVSSKGYYGLTSPGTQEGDLVCVFEGMITPIIIRPVETESPVSPSTPPDYILVGEAYHHGIAEKELEFEPQFMGPIRLV